MDIQQKLIERKDWMLIDKLGDMFFFEDIKGITDYLDLTYNEVYAIIHYCRKRLNIYSPKHKVYIQRLFNNKLSRQPAEKMLEWNMDRKNQYLNYWVNIKCNGSFAKFKVFGLSKLEYQLGKENYIEYITKKDGENNL